MGILARVEEYKGHVYLAQAAHILKSQGRKFRILVAGTGAFEARLREIVVEQGVEDEMTLLGFRSDVAGLLSILDVQLNASYGTEATSMALLEGMSLALPSIVSGLRRKSVAGERWGQRPDLSQPGQRGSGRVHSPPDGPPGRAETDGLPG